MRVLVTRPQPGACETGVRLAALGFEPVLVPLTEIVPLAAAIGAEVIDAVAVTSANAIRHASPAIFAALGGKPVFAVGKRTGAAAREAGLDVVDEDAGDAEGLARRINAFFPAPGHVTVLCGRVRRDILETRLRAAGHRVRLIETYDTLPLEPSDAALAAALGDRPVGAVLVHSANGARQLCRLIERPVIGTKLADATFYCLSARIADALERVGPERKEIAAQPAEEQLLALLSAHVGL